MMAASSLVRLMAMAETQADEWNAAYRSSTAGVKLGNHVSGEKRSEGLRGHGIYRSVTIAGEQSAEAIM